jgi:hypothetical protein
LDLIRGKHIEHDVRIDEDHLVFAARHPHDLVGTEAGPSTSDEAFEPSTIFLSLQARFLWRLYQDHLARCAVFETHLAAGLNFQRLKNVLRQLTSPPIVTLAFMPTSGEVPRRER